MTYWINVWKSNQRPYDIEPTVQHWSTEEAAVEEIVDGPAYYFYDETIKVDGKTAEIIDLSEHAEEYRREQETEAKWERERAPSWA